MFPVFSLSQCEHVGCERLFDFDFMFSQMCPILILKAVIQKMTRFLSPAKKKKKKIIKICISTMWCFKSRKCFVLCNVNHRHLEDHANNYYSY